MAWWDLKSAFAFSNFRDLFRSQGILNEGPNASPVNRARFSHPYFPLIQFKNDQNRMREAQLTTHTVRSHGVSLAVTHKHDWLILMLLVAVEVILNVIQPFHRFVGKDMMTDLKYPLKDSTVPVWAVPVYTLLLPMVVFLFFYLRRRDVYDLHHSMLGLLFSLLVTGVITDSLKDAVGRPRPDFFWRCFPDGKDAYDQWGNVVCHGGQNFVKEGYKSFPSGHTSWSFAGLGFLSLYLSGKLRAFDRRGHIGRLCILFLPLLAASLVGISRVDDYRHHWQDVFAGGLIGLVVAIFCYLQFFPPPYHSDGWGTYAYFRALEEMRAIIQPISVVETNNAQNSDAGVGNHQIGRGNQAFAEMSLYADSGAAVEDMESGRR